MSDPGDSNVFLILIRLDLSDINPLGGSSLETRLPRMEDNKKYALVAGLLDPSLQTTRTPLTPICFSDEDRQVKWQRCYNDVLEKFKSLIEEFYSEPDGLVLNPGRLDRRRQEEVGERIERLGSDIYNLIPRNTPLCKWFDEIFEPAAPGRRPKRLGEKHVTIITNDFNIPWYWMKGAASAPLLCEVCSLGMLQLANRNTIGIGSDESQLPGIEVGESLRALLINGAIGLDLPFVDEEVYSLCEFIQRGQGHRLRLRPFKVDVVTDTDSVSRIWRYRPKERRRLYRLVHYSGHWSVNDKDLMAGGEPLDVEEIKEFVDSAILALDGCSSSRGVQAWSEIENLTSKLLNFGALGCVVTTLPVKNDPIASKVFWEAFYSILLADTRVGPTVGQALVEARQALKKHYKDLDSVNPAWTFYQLIGNPSVKLIEESHTNHE